MTSIDNKVSTWPLRFNLSNPESSSNPDQRNWSHDLYRGPNNQRVGILYSQTKDDSEKLAQTFLKEPIIGFDMEWNSYVRNDDDARLQERIGLIQLACEDKIGLFHVGLHRGSTSEDLIAPTLRRIIESPNIIKTGVHVVSADFSRLSRWFALEPRGAFELSHLHNLITYAESDLSKCTRKIYSLANHVETHLGLQLSKGAVRTSRWNTHLSREQRHYAAADAYACFMLYHCMNAKRLAMTSQPPLPIPAETYDRTERSTLLRLQPLAEGGEVITVVDFYHPPPLDEGIDEVQDGSTSRGSAKTPNSKRRRSQGQTPRSSRSSSKVTLVRAHDLLDTMFSDQVFAKLRAQRLSIARRKNQSAFIIAPDSVLRELSQKCPQTTDELLQIKGVGPGKVTEYGQGWLNILNTAILDLQQVDLPGPPWRGVKPFDLGTNTAHAAGEKLPATRASVRTPNRPPPTLHTGLSFDLAGTKLSDNALEDMLVAPASPSDSSSAFENDERSPSPSSRKRKMGSR